MWGGRRGKWPGGSAMFAAETHEESLSQEWVERKGENGVFQDGGAPGPPRDRDLGELVRQVSGLAGGGSEGCREMRLKKRAGRDGELSLPRRRGWA